MTEEIDLEFKVPWEKREGEPNLWYHRFRFYFLPLGPERNMSQAWYSWALTKYADDKAKLEKIKKRGPTPAILWYKRAAEWDWEVRALAWDEDKRRLAGEKEKRDQEFQEALRQETIEGFQQMKLDLVEQFGNKVTELLKEFTAVDVTLASITTAVRGALAEMRIELQENPAQKIEIMGKSGGPIEVGSTRMDETLGRLQYLLELARQRKEQENENGIESG